MESRPWNKVPDGQFVKKSPPRYLNRDKRYGRRKNPFRHKKSTGEKNFLTLMESRVQRRLVHFRVFFYQYIINQCICKKKIKKSSPSTSHSYTAAYGNSNIFEYMWWNVVPTVNGNLILQALHYTERAYSIVRVR